MANIITGIRVLAGIALLFCPAFTPAFYFLYLAAGISDIADGAAARKTNTVSEFGSRLDTAADLVFAAVCLIKLLPVVRIPCPVYIWISVITIIKLGNIAAGYIKLKKFAAVHSVLNKVTGGLCFIFPFTLSFIDTKYSAIAVCIAATAAAFHEGYIILNSDKSEYSCALSSEQKEEQINAV